MCGKKPIDSSEQATAEDRHEMPRWHENVQGGKYVRILQKEIHKLRDSGAHGNRQLFLDDVLTAYLLTFYNPTIDSLRTLEDFSQTQQAQRFLSIPKITKSTLSDFNKLADPKRLQPIMAGLRRQLLKRTVAGHLPRELSQLHQQIFAVDGTFLQAAADVVWAIRHRNGRNSKKSGVRLDFHVDVDSWMPEVVAIADQGQSESQNAATTITPGAIHLYDRGIFSFELIEAHQRDNADFVMRMREAGERCPKFDAHDERALSDADGKHNVISDRIGRLSGSKHRKAPEMILREVVILNPDDGRTVRLLTTMLDVPAWVIGLLYQHRWQVELFFRWLKTYAQFDHLISHQPGGVLLSFYAAVIGVMLMYLATNSRPSKYMFILLGMVASGAATFEEILPILRERERKCRLERERRARKRAAEKKS